MLQRSVKTGQRHGLYSLYTYLLLLLLLEFLPRMMYLLGKAQVQAPVATALPPLAGSGPSSF